MDIIRNISMKIFIVFPLLFLLTFTAKSNDEQSKKDADFKMRENMITISRHLGITCTYCHNMKNLRSDEKKEFRIAKKHIEVTNWLNTTGFAGTPKVDCYLCHRGHAKPEFREVRKSL